MIAISKVSRLPSKNWFASRHLKCGAINHRVTSTVLWFPNRIGELSLPAAQLPYSVREPERYAVNLGHHVTANVHVLNTIVASI
jgi:hypothetical protein